MSQLRLSFLLPLVAFGILALVGGMALYGTLSGSRDPTQLPSVLVDKPAPQTNLPRLAQTGSATNDNVSVTMFQGKPVLVNFFASWCAPCRAEAPALEMLSKRVAILGIAYKDRGEDATAFLQQYGNPFQAIGMDADGRTGIEWGVYGVPETYLLDANGVVKLRHAGPLTRGVLESTIFPALEALGS
ncbi:DsbE family thiol:disulfide interchange protein [Alphaproteobacteria bacterium]|nr:DsbE family thiol:disulfide interchange protein [Alphaproteobacteria bacterium]